METVKTDNNIEEIAEYLLWEIIKVSSAAFRNVMTRKTANEKLNSSADECAAMYGLAPCYAGFKMVQEALKESAPDGIIKFQKKDVPDLHVPVIRKGMDDYFGNQTIN